MKGKQVKRMKEEVEIKRFRENERVACIINGKKVKCIYMEPSKTDWGSHLVYVASSGFGFLVDNDCINPWPTAAMLV